SHGLTLDGDAALAFDVHPIEVLRAHAAFVEDTRELQHPIGQCRLPVVDVRDDAEVADELARGAVGSRCVRGGWHAVFLGSSSGRTVRGADHLPMSTIPDPGPA